MRRLLLIALAFAALAAPASAAPLLRANFVVRISGATPYPQGCGVQGEQTPSSEAEPYIAANPADPQQVIAIYQQERFAVDGGALSNMVAISGDGGRTFPEVPPRVEYTLTEKGEALVPIIEDMRAYGRDWLE